MHPDEFLVVARELLDENATDHSEAYMRTVVNRAYLAALLTAALHLRSAQGTTFPDNHRYYSMVEEELQKLIGENASDMLFKLRCWRSEADYELQGRIGGVQAAKSIFVAYGPIAKVQEKL
jgi:hypothetical protein